MKIHWETADWPGSHIEPAISYMAWMPQQDHMGHGMLGVGCDSGSVGITLTDYLPTEDDNARYNFNLRGHHSSICMVKWNRAQSKLASCDSSGVIYVWVRNEDRWSVELVNDRGVKVRDLSWSPNGNSALICYEDNFVLIGSSTGQRVWSNNFTSTSNVTCGSWAPNSNQIILGFSSGRIQVLSDQGVNITERPVCTEAIQRMECSVEKSDSQQFILAMLTSRNRILMLRHYDQVEPFVYESPCAVHQMQWNEDGTILLFFNDNHDIVMLDRHARCIHRELVTVCPERPLSAITWAHGGNALIVAAGGDLAIGKVYPGVPSLFNLVIYDLWRFMGCSARKVDRLPLPVKERNAIRTLDHHIIRCRIPRPDDLCSFVCSFTEARCYCTIKPIARNSHSYVLCMEHLGGLVPLLVGRQVNRILPQFHVSLFPATKKVPLPPAGSSAQVEDLTIIPRSTTGRNSLWRRSKRQIRALMSRHVRPPRHDLRLAQVSSNVWCTKFSIASMSPKYLPEFLGQVIYKTSVLHLQPRQMTIDLSLLTSPTGREFDRRDPQSLCPSPAISEDDDQLPLVEDGREEDGFTKEERAFFEKLVSECLSLRGAMEATRELTTAGQGTTSQVSAVKESPVAALKRTESIQGDADLTLSTTSTFHDEIEALEFIDDNEERELLGPCSSRGRSRSRPRDPHLIKKTSVTTAGSAQPSTSKGLEISEKMQSDIQLDLERLVRMASQLSNKYEVNTKNNRSAITRMRTQMKDMLKKVNEIEKKVGNDDVRAEVHQLMSTLKEIKNALGEGKNSLPAHCNRRVLTMHNKTPFWNEHNQVYQLDFGGRVTQESAKNFQVELDGKQVLQFGRIDGGAYTLDFRRPFSATQAFCVALASITQRLK